MDIKYLLYFFIGGIVVSVVTYFASQAKGLLAAFIANLPVITSITFLTIYFESGQKALKSYAYGLIIMLFPWVVYVLTIIFLPQRIGFLPSLAIGICLYFLLAYVILSFTK